MQRHVRRISALLTAAFLIGLTVPSARSAPKPDFNLGLLLPYSGVFGRIGETMSHAIAPTPDVALRKFRKLVEQDHKWT